VDPAAAFVVRFPVIPEFRLGGDLARQCARLAAAATMVRGAMPAMIAAGFPGRPQAIEPIADMIDLVARDFHQRCRVYHRVRRLHLRADDWPSMLDELDRALAQVVLRHRRLAERFDGDGPQRALYDEIRRLDDARVCIRSLAYEFEDALVERRN
jgi:hypothetical protein